MSALNDLYQLIVRQSLDNQEILNVYHYKATGAAGWGADALAHAFYDGIDDLLAIQTTSLHVLAIEAINLMLDTDFYVYTNVPYLTAGSATGEPMPPYCSFTFMLERSSRLSRNGSKRIAGMTETASDDGVNPTGAYATKLNLAAAVINAELEGPAGSLYTPVILHPIRPGHPTLTSTFINGVRFTGFGTQNTRKIGRGR
jgi:hypothetical protein